MKKVFIIAVSTLIVIQLCISQNQHSSYPSTQVIPEVNTYHGVQIVDSYQWLENTESGEVIDWMNKQEKAFEDYLQPTEIKPIKASIERLENTGISFSVPQNAGDKYFYTVSQPDRDHSMIYVQNRLGADGELLLDMNEELKPGETFGGFSVCPNAHFMVVRIRNNQDTYGKLRVFYIDEKRWFDEDVEGTTSANVAWTYQNGFYYIHYGNTDKLNRDLERPRPSIRFHKVNSDQSSDLNIIKSKGGENEPIQLFTIHSSQDHHHLVVKSSQGQSNRNKLLLVDASTHNIVHLVSHDSYMFNFVGNKEDEFFFYTNHQAPNGMVISINKNQPEEKYWKTMVKEQTEVLAGGSTAGGNAMNFVNDRFVLLYREGTQTQIRLFDSNGNELKNIPVETGWIGSGLVGRNQGRHVWYTLNTFLSPSNVYILDVNSGETEVYFDRGLPIDRTDYVVQNTYYTSFDGTNVPIYICHKKGLVKDGSHPIFMYGYGFGGWVATPWYQPHILTFIEMGGIYVLPGVRGGGEFGDAWRDAGIRLNRQNAINDYIAAGEYLIKEGYTDYGKLVANGWSASGSLAAAASMQRPDLFGAAMIGIPSLDMLRYEEFTAFKGWTSGYGSVSIKDEFLNLYNWSPYHNIKSNSCYPPMIVTVGEKDKVTPPQHGYKFVAAMQAHQPCERPVYLKIVRGGGHGFGVSREQTLQTQSEEMAFLAKVLNMDVDRLKSASYSTK